MRLLGLDKVPIYQEKGDFGVTSEYGWREHPITHKRTYHSGIDGIRIVNGKHYMAHIVAIGDGEVIDYDNTVVGYSDVKTKGNYVKLKHESGRLSLYLHLAYESIPKSVKIGAVIKQGEVIGEMGSTGRSTDAHIHFQVYDFDGKTIIDPEPFLLGKGINDDEEDEMFVFVSPCKRGDKGEAVLNLQIKLCQQSEAMEKEIKGHSSDAYGHLDGVFGKGLENSLRKWQERAGIEATGECDEYTASLLNDGVSELSAKIKTASDVLNN